jgi:4-aminobutyrate--pyruvate transaminase
LRRRFTDHELVGEVRGTGMIGAVELVADKAARKNFDPALKIGPRMAKLCESHGVISRSLPNDSMAFSPPLIMTEAEAKTMLDRFEHALDDLTVQLRRERLAVVA